MEKVSCDKMIIAILQGDDYPEIVKALSEHGLYSTIINSTGGFLKKKSVTVMIGVAHDKLDVVLEILKSHAGERKEVQFMPSSMGHMTMPIEVSVGGIVAFVMDVERFEKY